MIYGNDLSSNENENVQNSDKPENYPLSPYLKDLLTLEALRFNHCLDSQTVINNGNNLSVLGKGHYGVVLKLNEHEAFKTLPENMLFNGDEAWRRLLKEFRIWKTITDSTENERRCQHIAQVVSLRSYAVCKFRHKFIGIVSTLYRCNLANYIADQKNKSKYNRMEVLRIIQQIIEAVQFLHSVNIIHGDIAIRNFLIKGERGVVICDFGLSHKLKKVEQPTTTTESFRDKTKWGNVKNKRWKDLFNKFKLYYKDDMHHYNMYYKDDMDQITEEKVKDQIHNESLDRKNIYKSFYEDLNPQDQPFWWCSPELCQQVLDHANRINASKKSNNNDLQGIITNFASDEYMVGCTIAELITIEENFIPFSNDYRYHKDRPEFNLLLFKGLTALEKCINLKKFDCLKIPEKNLIKDCSNLRFYYEELTKPKITDRCLLAQIKFKIDLQVKPNNNTIPTMQPKSYFAAINLQALVGSVETELFNQEIKNMITKRNHELVAYPTLDKKDSYKSIKTILNKMPANSKPQKIDAALIYLNCEQIKNYQGNTSKLSLNGDQATKLAKINFTNFVTKDDTTNLVDFMMKAYNLLANIKNNTKAGILVLYNDDLTNLEEAGLRHVLNYIEVSGSKMGIFPNLGCEEKNNAGNNDNNQSKDENEKNLEKFAPVIVANLMQIIGNTRIYTENKKGIPIELDKKNSEQFS